MANRTKIENAKVNYKVDGSKKQLTFEFKTIKQPELDETRKFVDTYYSKSGAKMLYNGKWSIGRILVAVTEEIDKSDTVKIGIIQNALFPELSKQQRANYKWLYNNDTGENLNVISQFRTANYPNLNSIAHLKNNWIKHVRMVDTLNESDTFIDWNEGKLEIGIKVKDLGVIVSEYDKFLKESDMPARNASKGEDKQQDRKPADVISDLGKITNEVVTLFNTDKLDETMLQAVYDHLNKVYKHCFTQEEIETKKAA